MTTPFLGEIRLVSFDFAPDGWARCDGRSISTTQNPRLFELFGYTYGGAGGSFLLPKLQGRVAMHAGRGHAAGEAGGEERHTLARNELPTHTHQWNTLVSDGNVANPLGALYAKAKGNLFGAAANPVAMAPETALPTGASQPHENRQPYLVLNYIVALVGVMPSRP